ncbi:hypothetical protein, partial [Roseivivax lentus]|uniref:hypothetical protein n=1 Tax=Roseivivax lentus TaxID=633194 RepID=UPI001F336111
MEVLDVVFTINTSYSIKTISLQTRVEYRPIGADRHEDDLFEVHIFFGISGQRLVVFQDRGQERCLCFKPLNVGCHRELTRQQSELSLRFDPCGTLPLTEFVG